MAEDYTVFWKNNAHAYQLFQSLLERAERSAYDDDFLAQLAAYRETAPESERADIFAAWYLLAHGDAENAARCGVNAFQKRPVNYEVWKILAASYKALGRDMEAIDFIGYAYGLYDALIADIDLKDESFQRYIDRFSLAIGIASGAPILVKRIYTDGDQIGVHADAFAGEPIPSALPSASPPFWSACYADNQFLSDKALLLSTLRRSDIFCSAGIATLYSICKRPIRCPIRPILMYQRGVPVSSLLQGQNRRKQYRFRPPTEAAMPILGNGHSAHSASMKVLHCNPQSIYRMLSPRPYSLHMPPTGSGSC